MALGVVLEGEFRGATPTIGTDTKTPSTEENSSKTVHEKVWLTLLILTPLVSAGTTLIVMALFYFCKRWMNLRVESKLIGKEDHYWEANSVASSKDNVPMFISSPTSSLRKNFNLRQPGQLVGSSARPALEECVFTSALSKAFPELHAWRQWHDTSHWIAT